MDTGIGELLQVVGGLLAQQATLEDRWIGRQVRLTEPFGWLPGNRRVLLPRGAVGQVVRVRLVQEAPLVLRFRGVEVEVAPLPYMLEVVEDE